MRRTIPILLLLAVILLAAAPALAQSSSADAEVAFTYGVRAFNRGEWDEAVRLFREAAAAAPDDENVRAWLELALAKQRGGTVSAPGFDGLVVLSNQPRFDFRAGAFYGQDSNPAELPDDVIAFGSGIGGSLAGEVEDDVVDLDLRAAAYPFYGRGGWSLGLSGQVKASRFQELDFLDQRQWRAAGHLAWGSDPLGYLTGPLGYTRVPFGHSRVSLLLQAGRTDTEADNPLLTADEAALSVVFRETVKTATQIELDIQKREILDSVDADFWSVGASQLFFLGARNRYLRFGVARGKETDGLIGDRTALDGTVELALPLNDRLNLQTAAVRRKEEIDPGSFPSFDDTTTRAAASLSWRLVGSLYLVGRASWAERDSTLSFFTADPLTHREYQRTAVSLGIQWIK
jgi:hypothetical protein